MREPRRPLTPFEERLARTIAYVVVVGGLILFGLFLVLSILRAWDALV